MTNFGWGQEEAAAQGKFMCDICYDWPDIDEAYMDAEGQRWSVCRGQCAAEAGMEPGPEDGPSEASH